MVFLAAIGNVGATQVDLDHDLRGNVLSRTRGGGWVSFGYDLGDRVVTVGENNQLQSTHRYDGLGRRTKTTKANGDQRFQIYTQGGQFVWEGDFVSSQGVASGVNYVNLNGSLIAKLVADWSLPAQRDGAPSYTGHPYDTGTGLIYAQQRYYDPQLGVFYSPDPMAVDTTSAFNFNRYAYANNSPYKFTDPDGREVIAPNAVQRQTLASLISRKSSSAFSFGDDGKLKQAEGDNGSGGKSEYYASRLNEAIASERKIYVVGMKEYKGIDVVNEGGITQASPDGDAAVIVSALPVNLETMSDPVDPANVLAHELVGHAIPHAVGGGSGNAVKEDNIVREQNGDPPRPAEPDHCSTCEHMP